MKMIVIKKDSKIHPKDAALDQILQDIDEEDTDDIDTIKPQKVEANDEEDIGDMDEALEGLPEDLREVVKNATKRAFKSKPIDESDVELDASTDPSLHDEDEQVEGEEDDEEGTEEF